MNALDTFASQRAFRALLEALSHPGRVVAVPAEALPPAGPAALAIPLALADLGQAVAVVGGGAEEWLRELAATTGCRAASPAEADQVVVLHGADAALIGTLRRGDAFSPEKGCRLTLACHALGGGSTEIELTGPGVDGTSVLAVDGLDADVFNAIRDANASFPAGIDTFLVDPAGLVVGIPRSSSITVQPGRRAGERVG